MSSKFSTSSETREFRDLSNPKESDLIFRKKFKGSRIDQESRQDFDHYSKRQQCKQNLLT